MSMISRLITSVGLDGTLISPAASQACSSPPRRT
jgi:hypothetical protein